jgi:hypothetical protein
MIGMWRIATPASPVWEMLTIAPDRCCRKIGNAACVTAMAPKKLVSMTARSRLHP